MNALDADHGDYPVVFLFAGQGSQTYHMGRELYDHNASFRSWIHELDTVLLCETGVSVAARIYNARFKRSDPFDELLYTGPAIFMIEYALARTLLQAGVAPAYVVGASLGELVAAAVSGALSLEDALKTVVACGNVFRRRCAEGGMLAVFEGEALHQETRELHDYCEIAAVNSASHFIVSGSAENLREVERYLSTIAVSFVRLPVKYAFHSSLMDAFQADYLRTVPTAVVRPPSIPIVSCLTAGLAREVTPSHLWSVIRQPIRVSKTVEFMNSLGALRYVDLSPGSTFANMVKYNLPRDRRSMIHPILTPFGTGLRNLQTVLATLGLEMAAAS